MTPMLEFIFVFASEHVAVSVYEFHHWGLCNDTCEEMGHICGRCENIGEIGRGDWNAKETWKGPQTLYEGERRNETMVSSNQEDVTASAILWQNAC